MNASPVHNSNLGILTCQICSKVLKTKSSLHNHMLLHKESQFSCENCSRVNLIHKIFKEVSHFLSHNDSFNSH